MTAIFPPKLQKGDHVRVIAPSQTGSIISPETRAIAARRFQELGLTVSFSDHLEEKNEFRSSSKESRLADLHAAFADPGVKAILTMIGGFNSNQLIDEIDWELIKQNPKIVCGYSDVTILLDSIYAKTGLVTYYGPHYSTFGQDLYFDYTLEYFQKCLMADAPYDLKPAENWSDDEWFINQQARTLVPNPGYWIFNEGKAEGVLLGGNLGTLNLLQGTPYMPSLKGSILFLEDDLETLPHHLDRDLQSLIHLADFAEVKGIVIGRFQKKSNLTQDLLQKILAGKKALKDIPVVGNVDFGHTDPKVTLPIGGTVSLQVTGNQVAIQIITH